MKIYPYPWSDRCWICQRPVSIYQDSNHFHTLWQVIMWLWDGHVFWRILCILALVAAAIQLASLIALVVGLLQGGHSLLYVIGGSL